MWIKKLVIVLLLLAVIAMVTVADANTANQDVFPVIKKLSDDSQDQREDALRQTIAFLNSLESSLVATLKTKSQRASDDKKAIACFLLGELRADGDNVIQVLVDQLDKSFITEMKDSPGGRANPPDALIKIGKPAIPKLIDTVLFDTNEVRRDLALRCVLRIERSNTVKDLLKELAEKQKDKSSYIEQAYKNLDEWTTD